MKKLIKLLTAIIVVLMTSQITFADTQDAPPEQTSPNLDITPFLFNEGMCDSNGERWYRQVTTLQMQPLQSDTNLRVVANIAILAGNEYQAVLHIDQPVDAGADNNSVSKTIQTQYVHGNWYFAGDKLMLSSLGTATISNFDGKPSIDLVINDDSGNYNFGGTSLHMAPYSVNQAPPGLELACPLPTYTLGAKHL